jgi:hypothetical protein
MTLRLFPFFLTTTAYSPRKCFLRVFSIIVSFTAASHIYQIRLYTYCGFPPPPSEAVVCVTDKKEKIILEEKDDS